MKPYFAVSLTLCLAALTLAGCGGGSGGSTLTGERAPYPLRVTYASATPTTLPAGGGQLVISVEVNNPAEVRSAWAVLRSPTAAPVTVPLPEPGAAQGLGVYQAFYDVPAGFSGYKITIHILDVGGGELTYDIPYPIALAS